MLNLVYVSAVMVGPRAPLVAVHGAKLAVGVGPFVPDAHAVVLQVFHVGVAFEEPEQFVYYRLQVQLFRCKQRKTVLKVEAHLVAEDAYRASAGAVVFLYAFRHYAVKQVEILFHLYCL